MARHVTPPAAHGGGLRTDPLTIANGLITLVRDNVPIILSSVGFRAIQFSLGGLIRLDGGEVFPVDIVFIGLYINQSNLTVKGIPVLDQLTDDVTSAGSILESPMICFSATSITSGMELASSAPLAMALPVRTSLEGTYVGSLRLAA